MAGDDPTRALQSALDSAQRDALVEQARARPQITLGELVSLSGDLGKIAASLTIQDILLGAGGSSARRAGPALRAAMPDSAPIVDTRTRSSRQQYDAQLLATLEAASGSLSADELRKKIGGTPLQARVALHRLVKARKVKRSGRARTTRYESRS